MVVLIGHNAESEFSPKTYCFVLATKKWQLLSEMPNHLSLSERSRQNRHLSTVSAGLWYWITDLGICYFDPKENEWRSKKATFSFWCQGC